MDYNVHRTTRRCATTGRTLEEGEEFFTALFVEGPDLVRKDYSREAWQGPPEGTLGWWKARVPRKEDNKAKLAPDEVLLQLFHELEEQPHKQDLRFVLALLLVRRRILKWEDPQQTDDGHEVLVLSCPRDGGTYRVAAEVPDDARAAEIQDELARLLFADAA